MYVFENIVVVRGDFMMMIRKHSLLLWLMFMLNYDCSLAIQCFSCKGAGLNEVAANINCLEKGYLENCDDFYEYYTKVLFHNFYQVECFDNVLSILKSVPLPRTIEWTVIVHACACRRSKIRKYWRMSIIMTKTKSIIMTRRMTMLLITMTTPAASAGPPGEQEQNLSA